LPALEHHTYSEDDVEEPGGGWNNNKEKFNFFNENGNGWKKGKKMIPNHHF
jgi:hypothetical protein